MRGDDPKTLRVRPTGKERTRMMLMRVSNRGTVGNRQGEKKLARTPSMPKFKCLEEGT